MTVYVDQLSLRHPKSKRAARYGIHWCHMFADTVEELQEFAIQKLGLKAEYLHNSVVPHIDLSPPKRKLALKHGAIKVQTKEYILRVKLASMKPEISPPPRIYIAKYGKPNG